MNYAKFQVIALNIPEDILSVNYSLLLYAYYQIDLFIGVIFLEQPCPVWSNFPSVVLE